MNTNEIESRLSAATGRVSENLRGAHGAIRANMDLTDAEREDAAIEGRLEERLDHNTFMRVMEVSALGDRPGGRR